MKAVSISRAHRLRCIALVALGCLALPFVDTRIHARGADSSFRLWPAAPPGETRAQGEERRVQGRPRPFFQITDVKDAGVEVFLPPDRLRNGTAVLVCPGGGLQRLAYEHEGVEVAEWLNSIGITAFVLKYRVPTTAETGLMDVQRAMGLLRAGAGSKWAIDSQAIGILGFSAGGELAAGLLTHADRRTYERVDGADDLSCAASFSSLVYPGGLLRAGGGGLKDALASGLKPGLPPVFLAHAFDDASDNSLELALALKRARIPTEVHVFQQGGHAFGVRATGVPVSAWKERFRDWLGSLGFLDPEPVRAYARSAVQRMAQGEAPPLFSSASPSATLEDAYRAQRRLVQISAQSTPIAGFKGAAASAAAQKALGIDRPFAGVVFRKGLLEANRTQAVEVAEDRPIVVETEIGYLISVDISYEILNDEQARGAVEFVLPIIELPRAYPGMGTMGVKDAVAMNIGSDRYIVGTPRKVEGFDPDAETVGLTRDGESLHQTVGGSVAGGQWHNLRMVLNELTGHGYTLPAGSIVLSGALGKIQPGRTGHYEARYGTLGTIAFDVRRP